MGIRLMEEKDLTQVLEIQKNLHFQSWTRTQFEREIKAPYSYSIVFENQNQVIGYAIFHMLGADSELLSIAVDAQNQQKGIGSSLLSAGLLKLNFNGGDACFLEVREKNTNARHFYEKHGFKEYSSRENYYADGEKAILYRR
ncbi:MAG: ribosomal protein S18-alanine N-acetyltransferase [Fibrobacteraceae bacterium]|nr:ribosomal protein S18-alanine N-acetyltransferase [Fibrobacteraceae bacterium]